MAVDTYDNLINEAITWIHRADISTTQAKVFCTLAEAEFNRSLAISPVRGQEDSTSIATSGVSVALPSDFLGARSVSYVNSGVRVALQQIAPEQLSGDTTTGEPAYYAIIGAKVNLKPAPNASYTVDIDYHKKVPSLSASVSTNWLQLAAPDLYLFGILTAASTWIVDDPRVPMWKAAYEQALSKMQTADSRDRWNGSAMQVRPA